MRLTIVGCSGSMPGPDGPASCYLVHADGFTLLLDFGNGAAGPLQRYAPLTGIDAICLSHLHGDHCLDLCSYWVARTYAPGAAGPPVPVYGPAGTAERIARAQGVDGPEELAPAFRFQTLTPGSREIGPFRVTTAHMNHPVETFGFRLEQAGRSLAYSADTGESASLVDLAAGADLLLSDASFLTGREDVLDLHLTGRQAAEHAHRAGVGRLMLTHLPPWTPADMALEEAAASAYTGPITVAAPGQSLELS